jgi:hypothetical protein
VHDVVAQPRGRRPAGPAASWCPAGWRRARDTQAHSPTAYRPVDDAVGVAVARHDDLTVDVGRDAAHLCSGMVGHHRDRLLDGSTLAKVRGRSRRCRAAASGSSRRRGDRSVEQT